jgi:ABC-type multidrug transport system permease subunit
MLKMTRCKENFIALCTIVRREVSRFLRIWSQTLLPPVITMTLYFVIFGNLIGSRIGDMAGVTYMQYIVPGLIMMSIITSSYMNVVSSFFVTKFQRNIEEMIVSPMPSQVIFWGFILGGVYSVFPHYLRPSTLIILVAYLLLHCLPRYFFLLRVYSTVYLPKNLTISISFLLLSLPH